VTRVIAYIRVSTDKQADVGVSLEAQESKLRAYASLYDLELIALEVDTASASSLERPALQRALTMLRRGKADALLVVKLDRLTRSVRDLADLLEKHFRKRALLSVSEQVDTRTASGELVLNLLTSVGQWERKAIGERTAAAMSHLRAQGRYTGGEAPFGWARVGDELEAVPAEQAVLARARALRGVGLSHRAIAETLADEGLRVRGGVPGRGHVGRMLARPAPELVQ
jgi:DNA invertase Pin-like site-specific DNA recombinase